MSRDVSASFKAAAFAQQTDKTPIYLVTVTHPAMMEPLRFSSDATERLEPSGVNQPVYGTISRGDEYYFLPFTLILPQDQDRSAPIARLRMANISRDLIPILRSVDSPAQFLIEVVLSDDPDTVEIALPTLDLMDADYDAEEISLDLTIEVLANEPYPAESFDPSGFPALFE